MGKGTNFISEIGKYFKENDATSAMNTIMDITRTLNLSEKRLFGEESRCNCKYSQLQVLQLLLLFPCFMIKNAFNYSSSSLCGIADCGKDVFYRFLSREDYDWRKILINITTQLWRKTLASTERDDRTPVCLMVDDTDYPKRGIQTEMIGKVFSHVEHKMILGFKGLFLGITDGATQMLMDFCLVGEKGKKGTYNMKQKQLDARFSKERKEDSHTAKRIQEYDEWHNTHSLLIRCRCTGTTVPGINAFSIRCEPSSAELRKSIFCRRRGFSPAFSHNARIKTLSISIIKSIYSLFCLQK